MNDKFYFVRKISIKDISYIIVVKSTLKWLRFNLNYNLFQQYFYENQTEMYDESEFIS